MRRCVMALYMCVSICVWSDNQTVGPAVCLHLLVCACMSLCRATLVISSATAKIRRSNCGTWGFPPQCKHSRSVRLSGNSRSGVNMDSWEEVSCIWAQQVQGYKKASPKIFCDQQTEKTLLSYYYTRKSIRPIKTWVMRCWCGYLSGATDVWKNIRISMQEFLKPKGPMGQFCAVWCFDAVRQVRLII